MFVLWELIYRATHLRQWREHQRHVREFNAWQDGEGPMPQYDPYRTQ